MRRLLTILVLALVVGGAVGTLMTRDSGYVLVTYAGMSVETSLWFAIAALLVGYVLLRLIAGLLAALLRSGSGITHWQRNRRERNAHQRTLQGLVMAAEGNWPGARKSLTAVAELTDIPLVNYAVAARAANEMGDAAGRDALLAQAAAAAPASAPALEIVKAELQIAAGEHDEAIATLSAARGMAPKNVRILLLLVACHEHCEDWPALLALTPELEKQRAMASDLLFDAQRRWWIGFFGCLGRYSAVTVESALQQWEKAGKALHGDPAAMLARVQSLIATGDMAAAEAALRQMLNDDFSDELVAMYGRLRSPLPDRQLHTAEAWLKGHPNNAQLLLTLGRLAQGNGDAAKARVYFEQSMA